ncbi:UNVERIFIED_CONTAM: protein OBERON 4 [Sesamum radiatum]|uniref:Protein OBERON 4 n=1 Tax=Sesamum radiatum TaxID=300843 RepID=A0AAW2VD84_SESRA
MKRLRSSDDLHSYGEKSVVKDWGRRDEDSGLQRSSSSLHRSSYYKSSDSGRKVLSSSTSRYDRLEDDRESSRLVRKRSDYDLENYDRRKSYDRHRDGNDRGIVSSSPRTGYGMDQMHRSESFSGPRRDFPKGFRSERDRPKRDGFATSWRRFGGGKDGDDGLRNVNEASRGSRMEAKEIGKAKSPQGPRDAKSPAWSKDSGSERSKSVEGKKSEDMPVESGGPSSEREEGELEPDPQSNAPLAKPAVEDKAAVELNSSQEELNNEYQVENKGEQEKVSLLSVENGDASKMGSCSEQAEGGSSKDVENILNKNDMPDRQGTSFQGAGESTDEIDTKRENEGGNDVTESKREGCLEEDADSTCDEKLSSLQDQIENDGINVEVKAEHTILTGNMEITAGNEPSRRKRPKL